MDISGQRALIERASSRVQELWEQWHGPREKRLHGNSTLGDLTNRIFEEILILQRLKTNGCSAIPEEALDVAELLEERTELLTLLSSWITPV